ncbi:MAG: hypothetical protein KAT34_15115 [Candidatus Aminicenantes bacterium]|nr:hypothetical protein [Candidatus Aminicenantes bacterium]
MQKHKVRAVHDDDLLKFLDSVGLRRPIEAGETTCHVCGETVSIDTLQAVLPVNKTIAVVCSRVTCVKNIEAVTGETA